MQSMYFTLLVASGPHDLSRHLPQRFVIPSPPLRSPAKVSSARWQSESPVGTPYANSTSSVEAEAALVVTVSVGVSSIAFASSSFGAAADEEATATSSSGGLGTFARAFWDCVRLAFVIPLVLGVVVLVLDPRDALFGWLPVIWNFARVPAETSWSILRV